MIFKIFTGILVQTVEAADKEILQYYTNITLYSQML